MVTLLHREEAEQGGIAESGPEEVVAWRLSVLFPGVSSLVDVTVYVVCPTILTFEQMP